MIMLDMASPKVPPLEAGITRRQARAPALAPDVKGILEGGRLWDRIPVRNNKTTGEGKKKTIQMAVFFFLCRYQMDEDVRVQQLMMDGHLRSSAIYIARLEREKDAVVKVVEQAALAATIAIGSTQWSVHNNACVRKKPWSAGSGLRVHQCRLLVPSSL